MAVILNFPDSRIRRFLKAFWISLRILWVQVQKFLLHFVWGQGALLFNCLSLGFQYFSTLALVVFLFRLFLSSFPISCLPSVKLQQKQDKDRTRRRIHSLIHIVVSFPHQRMYICWNALVYVTHILSLPRLFWSPSLPFSLLLFATPFNSFALLHFPSFNFPFSSLLHIIPFFSRPSSSSSYPFCFSTFPFLCFLSLPFSNLSSLSFPYDPPPSVYVA